MTELVTSLKGHSTLRTSLSGIFLPTLDRIDYATEGALHTPSIAFRHLPQNSARTGYAIEGELTLYLRADATIRVQELCESRGGRPGLSVLMSLTVSVDVKQH